MLNGAGKLSSLVKKKQMCTMNTTHLVFLH